MATVVGMNVILVPGFWLDASSWDAVTPAIEAAGHRPHPITLPGLEAGADPSGIGLDDQIDAVVAAIDSFDEDVVLVGHSGGGAIIHAAVDRRPDRVARAIYVDSGPLGDGGVINDELPTAGDTVPLPDWNTFEDAELNELDDTLREEFRARARPEPKGVAFDKQHLHDERRYDVPVTIITTTFPSAVMKGLIAQGHPMVAELGRITDYEIVDLPTSHWPQFTRPSELAEAIVAALS